MTTLPWTGRFLPTVDIFAMPATSAQQMRQIVNEVSSVFAIEASAIRGRSRFLRIVEARQLCMLIARRRHRFTTMEIGRMMDRDHTTVIHGLRHAEQLILHDPQFRAYVQGHWPELVQDALSCQGKKSVGKRFKRLASIAI